MAEYRASELGSCLKAQAARRLGFTPLPPPEHMQAIFDRGNDHEEACVDAMLAHGYLIYDQQREVEIPVGAVRITGHLDGIVEEYGVREDRVLEIKSPAAWRKFYEAEKTDTWTDPLAHRYAWQISVYMHALQKEALIACLDDDGIHTFVIERPPIAGEQLFNRIQAIENIVRAGTLPATCSSDDYPCPFVYLHEDHDLDEDQQLDELVMRYEQAADEEKAAKALKDALKADIERHMGDRNKVETGVSKVTRYEQRGPSRISEDLLKADGLDPDLYRIQGNPTRRIRITMKGEQ